MATRCKIHLLLKNREENLWLKFATTVNVHLMGVDSVPSFRETRFKSVQTQQRAISLK